MILHIVNKHQANILEQCLRVFNRNSDSLLLIEDAVNIIADKNLSPLLSDINSYVLQVDIIARGLSAFADNNINCCEDSDFVALVCQHEKSISWF